MAEEINIILKSIILENEILKIARRIQAIAQTGLQYANDVFDIQRYEELRELSVKLTAEVTDADINKIKDLFTNETGFQTPKVDVRSVIVKDGKILLTKEKSDNKWSLPGGFADINYSAATVAEKEVFEETGLVVKTTKLLALTDTDKHNFPALQYHFYKIVFLCEIISGELRGSEETIRTDFFDLDNLPELSVKRNTYELIELIKEQISKDKTYFD